MAENIWFWGYTLGVALTAFSAGWLVNHLANNGNKSAAK